MLDDEEALPRPDLTDEYAATLGREALVALLTDPERQVQQPGRIHELLVSLRPPWIVTCEPGGMIAARAVGLDVQVCYPETDPIKAAEPGRLVVIPLAGLLERPDSLILQDADNPTHLKREARVLDLLKKRLPDHELLCVGFQPADPLLRRMLQDLGPALRSYRRRVHLFVANSADRERTVLERRHCVVVADSSDATPGILESLPEQIHEALAAGTVAQEQELDDLVERMRQRVFDDTRHLLVSGISQPEHIEAGARPELGDIYVEPSLSIWEPATEMRTHPATFLDTVSQIARAQTGWRVEKLQHVSPLELLQRHRLLVIIGEPASGKSQLLQYIAHHVADPHDGKGLGLTKVVPLVVPIREYHAQRDDGDSLAPYLHRRLARLVGEEPEAIPDLMRERRVFLLLDGLDEVPGDASRNAISSEIQELLSRYRYIFGAIPFGGYKLRFGGVPFGEDELRIDELSCVITSRPAGYRAAMLTADLPHFELDLLDDDRIRSLLYNWYHRLLRAEQPDWDSGQVENEAADKRNELFERLSTFEGLRELVRNPLLLTIATFVHHVGKTLPERRCDFYAKAVELLTQTWLRIKYDRRLELPREDTLIAALERLGFALHRDSDDNLISGEALGELLLRVFREREGSGLARARREADNFRELMRSLIGIVVEKGVDRYGFTHLSFQEYFAARHLAVGDGRPLARELLCRNLYQSRWDQVIRMVLQLAPASDATRLFDRLAEVRHPFDDLYQPNPRRMAELLSEPNRVASDRRRNVLAKLLELARDPQHDYMQDHLIEHVSQVATGEDEDAVDWGRNRTGNTLFHADTGVKINQEGCFSPSSDLARRQKRYVHLAVAEAKLR